jgi:ABC-2 type transport system ATP-binding protein
VNAQPGVAATPGPRQYVPMHTLHIEQLRKAYGAVVAVDGLDLDVARGECFGLLGPNGAGKTTTVEICLGLTEPDAGDVVILGRRWTRQAAELQQRLGSALQETQLSEKLTVEETIRLFRSFYAEGRVVDDVIAVVQLEEKRAARIGTLSGGQKQRVALACALVGDPELLFLDEPTTGLDPQARRHVWSIVEGLRAEGRTVLLTTHYMEEAHRLCDRIAIVDHGRVIAAGTPDALIASLGADSVIEFAVQDADARVDAGALGSIGGVTGVEQVGDGAADGAARGDETVRWALRVREPHAVLPPLLALLTERGSTLAALETRSATLEDVFVSLTGRHIRDG